MKFVTDEPINNIDGVIAGTTYGYYDKNNQCLGYAQKRVFENENLEREYYLVFMDADGNPKDYLAEQHGEELYNYEHVDFVPQCILVNLVQFALLQ